MSQRKPLDLGDGKVAASFTSCGSLLSVTVPHPTLGLVELTAAPPFPAAQDGNASAVRQHRRRLADPRYAVLRIRDAYGEPDGEPHGGPLGWRLRGRGWQASADAWVDGQERTVGQTLHVRPQGAEAMEIAFSGRLDRPGYAEITPSGTQPPTLGPPSMRVQGSSLELASASASARVTVTVVGGTAEWRLGSGAARAHISWPAEVNQVEVGFRVLVTAQRIHASGAARAGSGVSRRSQDLGAVLDRVRAGAVRYTLGCTAWEVAAGMCCIVTDHRLLPLSWTRDAYYQAAALLASSEDVELATQVVERHLAWLFGPGRDERGVWQRSHLLTGAVKDRAYQADQQLYPLLELADFRRVVGRWPPLVGSRWGRSLGDEARSWGALVRAVWTSLPRRPGGLLPGEENPADDRMQLPLLLSSQLLLAYTGRRLDQWALELELADLHLGDDSAKTLSEVAEVFTRVGPFGPQWAYAADANGQTRLYQDANDVPTALAPLWGLCDADDPLWRTTMRFALSPHNPGYVVGRFGGLGSRHTPGVWALGDAQRWAAAAGAGDRAGVATAEERIQHVAATDGMLPETYSPRTGRWWSRHWFAWPGSLLATLWSTYEYQSGPWVSPTDSLGGTTLR